MPRSQPTFSDVPVTFYVDSGAGQSMCSCSESFHSFRACAVLVVGVAGTMPIHSMGTACFIVSVHGKEHILEINNCLFCHGEDCFNLLSVSQMLRAGSNAVVFSQKESKLVVQGKARGNDVETPIMLKENDGLYELTVTPLYLGDERTHRLPRLTVTRDDDLQLWEKKDESVGLTVKSPTKLGVWHCRMLWTSCKVGMQGIKTAEYEENLQEFCSSYLVPPSQALSRRTYKTTDVDDLADLSIRFMGVGTDRLVHTLERSRGLTPATKKKGESALAVPPFIFPQGKWKAGKTPRVTKDKVKNLHRASPAEVCFTDTFETDDGTYKYGQAVVCYRSRFGDIIPIRTRKKVGWAFAEFCCRHFTPLILIRDNIAENIGGELLEECRKRGIKSAYSCPYTPQQDYAEGYLGRVTAMASFAMVFSGAPMFMWRWAIVCAVFINNITATYYTNERIWATPWEVIYGEPFPDASIVVPFGCAALVLLNKEEKQKFKGTCAMMIFIHYAVNHPLYTYAVFSPRTKKVLFRQDVLFLPNVFPMREARIKSGLGPEGESLVVYRSPQVPGGKMESETSFGEWKPEDPLPPFQDHVTGYPLVSPADETAHTSQEKPDDWPRKQPCHPAFGPQSVVKVPVPWNDRGESSMVIEDQKDEGHEEVDVCDVDKVGRRQRQVKKKAPSPPKSGPKRRPVKERWYYEPVVRPSALALLSDSHGDPVGTNTKEDDEIGENQRQGHRIVGETREESCRSFEQERQGGEKRKQLLEDGFEKCLEMSESQSHCEDGKKSDVALEKPDSRKSDVALEKPDNRKGILKIMKNQPLPISSNENNAKVNFSSQNTGSSLIDLDILDKIGPTELIPCQQLDAAADDEATACALQGMLFYDDGLGWCSVTNWGVDYGTKIIFYAPVTSGDPLMDEQHASLGEVLAWLKQMPMVPRLSDYQSSRRLNGSSCRKAGFVRLLSAKQQAPVYGTMNVRQITALATKVKFLPARILRKILKAQETLFKYGTLIPKSDREAELSPEAVRWRSGRQLEWLRLIAARTFETDWTWERIKKVYPEYKRSDIGHMFYIYDYKYSGEHRVRLVFDGSRQSPNTYGTTYAPTVRAESVRLFHLYAVEYGWHIQQYDVPQAFLRSDADCTIFVHPPKGQSDFPGQILKLSKMLYGSKQAAALWYNLLNTFLLKMGFLASPMDPCFYRRPCDISSDSDGPRSDAIIILHVDDMRVAAGPEVLSWVHDQLFNEFQITTSDSGRFLGMDTEYDMQKGVFKMHMATYIDSTVERFSNFDLAQGIPYRELVGSLLWIVLCVMGTELLRVKDLARRSNDYTLDDYNEALKVLDRVVLQKEYGIIFRRGSAGTEYVPASTRLGGGYENDSEGSYSIGDTTEVNELEENNLYKLDLEVDDEHLDIKKNLAPTNSRFTMVGYTDASFAVGATKQSISGFDVMINGVPILWGSLKQTIVVDSTCSAEYVAASICCKQLMQAENMVQFLEFTCPRPYTLYTDSQACLKIATTASKMGMVRHLEIRYHLVRCIVLAGDIKLVYCITEEMLADLFTKIVTNAQDKRLAVRFYNDCVMDGV